MPLAKSATPAPPAPTPSDVPTIFTQKDTTPHVEFYRYFNLDSTQGDDQLGTIYAWANNGAKSV
ncbi:hypothetical protein, partial [Klebsiella pneumoniae]|uniref:hypothetical protein n=1 Tax=Klebsiella pneumoniae TaxID=573 RepID=UPI0025A17FF5